MSTRTSPIRTCVLGVGLAGLTFHIPFILALPQLFTLHSVLERTPQSPGGKVHDRFPDLEIAVKIHRSLDDVIQDPEVELMIIATPNDTHFSFAKAGLEAGKHVLVDKPVATATEQARQLAAIARTKGLVLAPFQNARWNSDFMALRKLLSQPESSPNSLGSIIDFEAHFDRYRAGLKGTWKDEARPGAGLTFDLGSHLIDQALVLFGKPAKVTAFIQNVRGIGKPEIDDSFTIYMHYPANFQSEALRACPTTVILRGTMMSLRSSQLRYIVRGTKGTYTKHGTDIQEAQLKNMSSPADILTNEYGREPEELWGKLESGTDMTSITSSIWPSSEAGSYTELFRNLATVIRDQRVALAVRWEEATDVIEIIELAHRSSREGVTIEVP